MKCLGCGSPAANEVNISINVSECVETLETEYTGYTDYGDPSSMIGTICHECGCATLVSDWRRVVISFFDSDLTYEEAQ